MQAWVTGRAEVLSPSTVMVVYRWASSIFGAVVGDDVIRKTPCVEIKLPKRDKQAHRVVPLEVEQVRAVADASDRTVPLPATVRDALAAHLVAFSVGESGFVFTLDTYSHLWPDSDDRTPEAVDAVLGAPREQVYAGV